MLLGDMKLNSVSRWNLQKLKTNKKPKYLTPEP